MCRPLTLNHKLVQTKVAVRSRPERRGDLFASLDLSREAESCPFRESLWVKSPRHS